MKGTFDGKTYFELSAESFALIFESEDELNRFRDRLNGMKPASPVRAVVIGADPEDMNGLVTEVQKDLNRDQHLIFFDVDANPPNPADSISSQSDQEGTGTNSGN